MCQNQVINGVTQDGGYGEYCLLRSEAAARIPSDIDPEEAAPLLCAGKSPTALYLFLPQKTNKK